MRCDSPASVVADLHGRERSSVDPVLSPEATRRHGNHMRIQFDAQRRSDERAWKTVGRALPTTHRAVRCRPTALQSRVCPSPTTGAAQ
jgi:hypothetical protein